MKVDAISNVLQMHRSNSVAHNKGVTPVFNGPLMADTVSFSGAAMEKLLTPEQGEKSAKKLAGSTSGYRDYYNSVDPKKPNLFNDAFVNTMTDAVVRYAQSQKAKSIMVTGDTREATKHYAPKINEMFKDAGFDVKVPKIEGIEGIAPVATPVAALATREFEMPISVLMTASHNTWDYGGYNFLTNEGAVATDKVTGPLADYLREISKTQETTPDAKKRGTETTFDPYRMYADHVKKQDLIDFDKIKESGVQIYYETMDGTGKHYFPQLMEENGVKLAKVLNSKAAGPNPSKANLEGPLEGNQTSLGEEVLKSKAPLKVGIATDGDSDRFGVVDENGKFVNENDVILLVAYNQIKYGNNGEGMKEGHIVRNHATSGRIDAMAEYFNKKEGANIEVHQTPVGFKYIGDVMIEKGLESVIVGGEESGGLTVGNHIPEKDGFVAVAKIAELVAHEGKPVGEILQKIRDKIIGDYSSERIDIKFDDTDEGNAKKDATVEAFKGYLDGSKTELAGFKVDTEKTKAVHEELCEQKKNGDGIKIYLENDANVLVRKSGTESLVKLYVDCPTSEILGTLKEVLVGEAKKNGGTVAGAKVKENPGVEKQPEEQPEKKPEKQGIISKVLQKLGQFAKSVLQGLRAIIDAMIGLFTKKDDA